MVELGPNGGGLLRWVLDNIPALVAALSAAGAILAKHRRRNFWVWLFAASAFIFTFFTELTSNDKQYGDQTESEGLPSEGR